MGKGSDAGFDPTLVKLANRLKLTGEESGFLEHIGNVRSFLSTQPPVVDIPTPEPDPRPAEGECECASEAGGNAFCQVPCLQSSCLTADMIVSPMLVFPGQYVGVIHTSPARRRAPKVPCVQRLLPVEVLECLVKTADNSFHFLGRVFETAATLTAGGTKLEDHVALVRREVLYTTATKVFPASAIVGPCEVFYQRDPFFQWEKRMPSDRRFLCRYIVQEKSVLTSGTRIANLTPLSLTKKRHLDSRMFGPQAQVLPSDGAAPLPASLREHYWLVIAELVEKRMGVRKSCERAEVELHMPLEAFAACVEVLGTPEAKEGIVAVEIDDFDRLQRTVFRSFRTFPLRVLDPPTAKKKRYQMPQEFARNDRSEARGPFRFELHTDQFPLRLMVSFTYVIRASGFGVTPIIPALPAPPPQLLLTAPPPKKKSSSSSKKKPGMPPMTKLLGELSCSLIEV